MTGVAATRVLSEAQTEAFDFEIVDDELWSVLKPALAQQLAGPSTRILDVGGGNGLFVDRVLEAFSSTSPFNEHRMDDTAQNDNDNQHSVAQAPSA